MQMLGSAALVRIASSAVLLVYLIAAWGSGLDRMSVDTPSLVRLVPVPLRARSDRGQALIALSKKDGERALVLAQDAVRTDPLEASSSSLLGSARQLSGDPAGAEDAFRVAASRGWRDILSQLYWFDRAIAAKDYARAALRADAIMRAYPNSRDSKLLLGNLEASGEGRVALAERLAQSPGWTGAYFGGLSELDTGELQQRAEVGRKVAQLGHRLGCKTPLPLTLALLDRGQGSEAAALWQANCDEGAPGRGLADGDFEGLAKDGTQSPFGWRRHPSGDVAVDVIEQGHGKAAVRARSTASVTRLVLSQTVALGRGTYVAKGDIRAGEGVAAGRIAFSLDCAGSPRSPGVIQGDAALAGQVLTVGACQNEVLGVWLRPGPGEVTLDDLTLERSK